MEVVGRKATLRFIESWDLVTVLGDGLYDIEIVREEERMLVVRFDKELVYAGQTCRGAELRPRFVGVWLQANDGVRVDAANFVLLEHESAPMRSDGIGGIADFVFA